MRALLAVASLALLAGCTGEDGAFAFQRGEAALDPYFMEYREIVAGSHTKLFDVPVDAAANLVNVTIQLDGRTNGLPIPDAAPAQLRAQLLSPAGVVLREAALDVRAPVANLLLQDAEPGLYHVQVDGFGASQDLDGHTYGSGYVVTIDVGYA